MLSQNLYEFLFSGNNLPEELNEPELQKRLIEQLNLYVKTITYKRTILLQQAGTITDKLYFVESGVVRGYTFDHEQGKEQTISLWTKGSLFTDPNSLIHQIDSELFIEVFPNTELSYVSRSHLDELTAAFPFVKSLLSWLIKNESKFSSKRLLDKSIPAWQRLLEMRKASPELEQMVSRTIIASFLNISPQHLSKIVRDNYRK
jgi:CRP-like cAMP-binding protein